MSTVFIKRDPLNKSKIRRKMEESDDDITDETNLAELTDIKLQQNLRAKRSGTTLENLSSKKQTVSATLSTENKTVQTLLGTQFSVRTDDGFKGGLPHDKMMEKYIEEKLGLNQDEKISAAKVLTEDDKLYLVPEDIKRIVNYGKDHSVIAAAAAVQKDGEANSITGASWAAGIAEVALPESFKLRNIDRTEKAVERQQQIDYLAAEQRKAAGRGQSGYYQRFQVSENTRQQPQSSSSFISTASALLGLDESEQEMKAFNAAAAMAAGSAAGAAAGTKKLKSTDDQAMNRFRKQQGYRR